MKRFLFFLPPVLLVLVALHQMYLSKFEQLSPWKGGGFGMFSSTELGIARYARIFVSAPNRSEELEIPESLSQTALKATTYPSNSLLQLFAEGIVLREQRLERPVEKVRIEIWRTRFDAQTLKPETEKLRDYVFQVSEDSH